MVGVEGLLRRDPDVSDQLVAVVERFLPFGASATKNLTSYLIGSGSGVTQWEK